MSRSATASLRLVRPRPRPRTLAAGLALALAAPAVSALAAQETQDAFQWAGRVAAGRTVYVKNLNGPIRVERGGGEVEITARKRWRRGNPERVRVEMERVGSGDGDVLVCAFWHEDATCDETRYQNPRRGWDSDRDGDVQVEFTVRVPQGVRLDLYTVNGGLTVEGATAAVRAVTTNGSIRAASLGGPVTARTVNGGIHARMGDVGTEDLEYETVNGSVTLELPAGVDADLSARTVNGSIQSDFPLTVQGRMSRRSIDATLGRGGRRLEVKTVNGSVNLKRVE